LFAAVITSFLAEARKKLRLEDSEALLMDIRSALRNEPSSDPAASYKPSSSQLWVNGLWFASLLITLFSAIVGVLARSWLVNHLPVSTRKEDTDAYRRWTLDKRADKWGLPKVITGIPFLVQIAFFLFSLGLGIQTYDDNKRLGILVLSLVAVGTLLYLVATVLPLVLPPDSCPFQTPLSDILRDLYALVVTLFQSIPPAKPIPKAFSETLATILYEGLISSGKAELVDEAALELSRHPPPPQCLPLFIANETPDICLRRIRECTSMRFDDPSRRDEIIGAHLQVLSQLTASSEASDLNGFLDTDFEDSISKTGILGRWDSLPESQRALAYMVRVPLYLLYGRDFEENPSPGNEWETIVHFVHPAYRLRFVKSACRGTVQGARNMRMISSFSIIYLIARGSSCLFRKPCV
jgi:Family of unknown function (DUF6535)